MPAVLNNATSLTPEEEALLKDIYRIRLKYACSFLAGIYFFLLWPMHSVLINMLAYHIHYDSKSYTAFSVYGFFIIAATLLFIRIFNKRINTFRKDYKAGLKTAVPFTILRKTYFPYTNQYFIELNDPDYMHHEVDEAFYNKCSADDTVYLYMAPFSKYIFEKNGRFTIL